MSDYTFDLGTQNELLSPIDEINIWMNRGMIWTFAFGHEEAIRCFKKVIEIDPNFTLAYQMVAYCNGINQNNPEMDDAQTKEAWEQTQKGLATIDSMSNSSNPELDKLLMQSLSSKQIEYEEDMNLERDNLDKDFKDAFKPIYIQYKSNPTICHMQAESLMNIQPWDLQTKEKEMKGACEEIHEVLYHGLEISPKHPGLLHLLIHSKEMSADPGKILPECARLRTLVPDCGHLNHMPSHIDMLVGNQADAIEANQRSVVANRKQLKVQGANNFQTLYRCHDQHLLAQAAMFEGKQKIAIEAAEEMALNIPQAIMDSMADFVESFVGIKYHVWIRFGKWQEIIESTLPEESDVYCSTTCLGLQAKTIAYATLLRFENAWEYRDKYQESLKMLAPSRTLFNQNVGQIMEVATQMLEAELAFHEGSQEAAFTYLRKGIKLEDDLPQDEPWGWMQPVRHAFGALGLHYQKIKESNELLAEVKKCQVEDDMKQPNNIWNLLGMAEVLKIEGKDATDVLAKLEKKKNCTDVEIKQSCFCRRD